jgi:hypothetical protein
MSLPKQLLPIGRWIYTTETPNSKGIWFFIGEEVQSPTIIKPNDLLHIGTTEPTCMTHTAHTPSPVCLNNCSTESLIDELMKKDPEIQKRLILSSMNSPEQDSPNKVH